MLHWENIWKFNTANFTVRFDAAPDDDLDLSWDTDGLTGAALHNGELVAFVARVTVNDRHTGKTLGWDTLHGCIYDSAEQFATSHRDPDPMNRNCSIMRAAKGTIVICHYFPGMVAEAIKEARATLEGANQ